MLILTTRSGTWPTRTFTARILLLWHHGQLQLAESVLTQLSLKVTVDQWVRECPTLLSKLEVIWAICSEEVEEKHQTEMREESHQVVVMKVTTNTYRSTDHGTPRHTNPSNTMAQCQICHSTLMKKRPKSILRLICLSSPTTIPRKSINITWI